MFRTTKDSRSLMHKALDDSERDVSPGFSKLLIAGKTPGSYAHLDYAFK